MAALHVFARTLLSTSCKTNSPAINGFIRINFLGDHVQRRWGSFKISPVYDENTKYTDFEVSNDPKEWMFVERCLRPQWIPIPPKDNFNLPSGWKPQRAEARDYPYFVERSRNHQLPVYLNRQERGVRRVTEVKKIQGDIIALEAELKEYLEKKTGRSVGVQLLEPSAIIRFRGDCVSLVKKWLIDKGF